MSDTLLVGNCRILSGTYFLLASAASCGGAVRGAESPPRREPQRLFMFTACTRSHTHTLCLRYRPGKYIRYNMPALRGSLIIIARSVISLYGRSSPLEFEVILVPLVGCSRENNPI